MPRRPLAGAAPARLLPALIALASALLGGSPAAAAGATTVVIPYGDWIVGAAGLAAQVLIPLLLAGATGLVAVLPWPLRLFLTSQLVEWLVRNALDYALNEVEGAAKGRTLTIDLGRAVLARAVARAVAQAPGWLLEAAGGRSGIAEKVFRLLPLDPAASAANTLAPVVGRAARDGR